MPWLWGFADASYELLPPSIHGLVDRRLQLAVMLAGFIAFARMQVNNAPDIDFPAAIVSVGLSDLVRAELVPVRGDPQISVAVEGDVVRARDRAHLVDLMAFANREVLSRPCRVIAVDNFQSGLPVRLESAVPF